MNLVCKMPCFTYDLGENDDPVCKKPLFYIRHVNPVCKMPCFTYDLGENDVPVCKKADFTHGR